MKSFFVQIGICVAIVAALFACLPSEAEAGGGLAFVAPQRTVRRFGFNPLTLTFRQSVRQDAPAAIVQRQIVQPFVVRQQFVQPFVQQQLVVPYVQQQLVVPQCQGHCQGSAAFFLR